MKEKALILDRLQALPSKRYGRGNHFAMVVYRNGLRCAKCHRLTHFQTVDHIIPKIKGGNSFIDNLQLLCLDCHREKDNIPKLVSVLLYTHR